MDDNFSAWLADQLSERGMTQADLSRASGISPTSIANLLNGHRSPGADACSKIAIAFRMPEETIFRIAGIMRPAKDDLSPKKRQLIHMAEQADDDVVEMALAMLEAAWERKKRQAPTNGKRKDSNST